MRFLSSVLLLAAAAGWAGGAGIRKVGPKQKYRTPCAAIAAARDGDTIEIDAAGSYSGDVCAFRLNRVTLRGVNGRARLEAGGAIAQGKGIWVIGGDEVTVENLEFSGAKCASKNGAGIRAEGGRLTIRNCAFRNNEDGILTNHNPEGRLLIEYSEFDHNGHGDGQSHNLYVGRIAEFTLRHSWSHDAVGGHLVKSRAAVSRILYNRLTSESAGTSYELNLPDGGEALVVGNVIAQSAASVNTGMMTYGEEARQSVPQPGGLVAAHNTFVNRKPAHARFIFIGRPQVSAAIRNNVFSGPGEITNLAGAALEGNVVLAETGFVNAAQWDFRLAERAAAVNAGVALPAAQQPRFQYRHPACAAGREAVGVPDAGAFERGGERPAGEEAGLPERCR